LLAIHLRFASLMTGLNCLNERCRKKGLGLYFVQPYGLQAPRW